MRFGDFFPKIPESGRTPKCSDSFEKVLKTITTQKITHTLRSNFQFYIGLVLTLTYLHLGNITFKLIHVLSIYDDIIIYKQNCRAFTLWANSIKHEKNLQK